MSSHVSFIYEHDDMLLKHNTLQLDLQDSDICWCWRVDGLNVKSNIYEV